jgi:teichoic acid transport system permease protein
MILNTSFPRAVFPVGAAIKAFLEFVPLLVALFAARAFLHQPFGLSMITMPIVIALMTIFALGLGLGTAAIMVFFRDFSNIVSLAGRLWLWSTPILYTTAEIPESVRWFLQLNPLYPYYAALEQIWAGQFPSMGYILWGAAWSAVSFVVGTLIFLSKERDFAVRL